MKLRWVLTRSFLAIVAATADLIRPSHNFQVDTARNMADKTAVSIRIGSGPFTGFWIAFGAVLSSD